MGPHSLVECMIQFNPEDAIGEEPNVKWLPKKGNIYVVRVVDVTKDHYNKPMIGLEEGIVGYNRNGFELLMGASNFREVLPAFNIEQALKKEELEKEPVSILMECAA